MEQIRNTEIADKLARGVRRHLAHRGYETLMEFPLANSRRADVIGLNKAGRLVIVEIKSGAPDFRADHKWPAYTDWCDRFYFCVDPDFPQDLLPADQGLIISDGFDADIIRPAREHPLHASRRKALILRFARKAAQRLHWVEDPNRYGA